MNYRIKAIEHGWAIEHKKIATKDSAANAETPRKKGDEFWLQEYYYGHLEIAAKALLEFAIKDRARQGEIREIEGFLKALKKAEKEVMAAVG